MKIYDWIETPTETKTDVEIDCFIAILRANADKTERVLKELELDNGSV